MSSTGLHDADNAAASVPNKRGDHADAGGKATASKPRKRFVGKSPAASSSKGKTPISFSSSTRSLPQSSIPADILEDPLLNAAIAQNLPRNYEFEVHKTIWNIRKHGSKTVALQMPEGLLMWGCVLSDIVERFTSAQAIILGDVTYGACCIDDYTAIALGCNMLVHYGHSCLVPIDSTSIRTLYVFVEISVDTQHLSETIRRNFPSRRDAFLQDIVHVMDTPNGDGRAVPIGTTISGSKRIRDTAVALEDHDASTQPSLSSPPTRLALVSTIQFAAALNRLKEDLSDALAVIPDKTDTNEEEGSGDHLAIAKFDPARDLDRGVYDITVPRSKPLSPGEILGCTAPRLKDVDAILYLADGRFHLEAIMIANPTLPAFRYDPYSKKLTREWYDHDEMRAIRGKAVRQAKATLPITSTNSENHGASTTLPTPMGRKNQVWGVILGTLGRQGSLLQMEAILRQLDTFRDSRANIPYMPILLSELSPAKLALFNDGVDDPSHGGNISTFIQTSCPRLSIDWGYAFEKPLLSPYEASVVLGKSKSWEEPDEADQRVYPMNFYKSGSVWATSRVKGKDTSWPLEITV